MTRGAARWISASSNLGTTPWPSSITSETSSKLGAWCQQPRAMVSCHVLWLQPTAAPRTSRSFAFPILARSPSPPTDTGVLLSRRNQKGCKSSSIVWSRISVARSRTRTTATNLHVDSLSRRVAVKDPSVSLHWLSHCRSNLAGQVGTTMSAALPIGTLMHRLWAAP